MWNVAGAKSRGVILQLQRRRRRLTRDVELALLPFYTPSHRAQWKLISVTLARCVLARTLLPCHMVRVETLTGRELGHNSVPGSRWASRQVVLLYRTWYQRLALRQRIINLPLFIASCNLRQFIPVASAMAFVLSRNRSEERRVGKECPV